VRAGRALALGLLLAQAVGRQAATADEEEPTMRKNLKKLSLKTERVRVLTDEEMGQVAGGLLPAAGTIAQPTTTVFHHTRGCSVVTTAINCSASGSVTTTAPNCGSGVRTTFVTCP
jgi:hypothetical protein